MPKFLGIDLELIRLKSKFNEPILFNELIFGNQMRQHRPAWGKKKALDQGGTNRGEGWKALKEFRTWLDFGQKKDAAKRIKSKRLLTNKFCAQP